MFNLAKFFFKEKNFVYLVRQKILPYFFYQIKPCFVLLNWSKNIIITMCPIFTLKKLIWEKLSDDKKILKFKNKPELPTQPIFLTFLLEVAIFIIYI